jgi:hypothetical protein
MCDSNSANPCQTILRSKEPTKDKYHDLEKTGQYDVWCEPGCDVVIQAAGTGAPGNSPPWHLTGDLHLKKGKYQSECSQKGSGGCRVKIVEAE